MHRVSTRHRRLLASIVAPVAIALLMSASTAAADPPALFHGDVGCATQEDGTTACGTAEPRTTTPSFDGVPLDVSVGLPAPSTGAEAPYPLIVALSGWSNAKASPAGMVNWLRRGYAVLSMTPRGFRESCGSIGAQEAAPAACAAGYVRLADARYEARDVQFLAGELADDGVVAPRQIGVVGSSYGGGIAMILAALKDRTMLPGGTLVPWVSPARHLPMAVAAATPVTTWSDLAEAFTPAGTSLDYLSNAPPPDQIGVEKRDLVDAIGSSCFGTIVFCAPAGSDPSADLLSWRAALGRGAPYGSDVAAMGAELRAHHSAYDLDHSEPPAPMLLADGFTDDWMPVDQALSIYNRTRDQFPESHFRLLFGDFGHRRAQNAPEDLARLTPLSVAWMKHYVQDAGPAPADGVEASPQRCGSGAPDEGSFAAGDWAGLAPGEVRLRSAPPQIISADESGTDLAAQLAPGCATSPADQEPGAATFRFPAAPAGGFTLLGAPTVIAQYSSSSADSQVAGRLYDVDPDGDETLVARGVWRPRAGDPDAQVFQLHANGWRFAEGHVAELELHPADPAYAAPPGDQTDVTVKAADVRLPVHEAPGALDGFVGRPAPKVVPPGRTLAREFASGHHEIGVTLGGSGSGRVTSDPLGLDCAATCSGSYRADAPVRLAATPAGGSLFTGWSGGGCSGTGDCVVTPGRDTQIHATFAPIQRSLTISSSGQGFVASAPSGISCGAACAASFDDGTDVTLTATPGPGWRFAWWVGGGCGTDPVCTVPMNADRSVHAQFERTVRTVAVAERGTGTGRVTSAPVGIDCGTSCTADFPRDATVTLKATPAPGSTFAGWSGAGCGQAPTCQMSLGADTAVWAVFDRVRHDLTVVSSGHGRVVSAPAGIGCAPVCTHAYDEGTDVTLDATANAGWRFAGWSGGGCGQEPACTVTLSTDTAVGATFARIQHTLDVTASGRGVVISDPAGVYCPGACVHAFDEGTTVTLTAHPEPGWGFAGWSGAGCGHARTCRLDLADDGDIEASFERADDGEPSSPPDAADQGAGGTGPSAEDSPVGRPELRSWVRATRRTLGRLGLRGLTRRGRLTQRLPTPVSGRATEILAFRAGGRAVVLAAGAARLSPGHARLKLRVHRAGRARLAARLHPDTRRLRLQLRLRFAHGSGFVLRRRVHVVAPVKPRDH